MQLRTTLFVPSGEASPTHNSDEADDGFVLGVPTKLNGIDEGS